MSLYLSAFLNHPPFPSLWACLKQKKAVGKISHGLKTKRPWATSWSAHGPDRLKVSDQVPGGGQTRLK